MRKGAVLLIAGLAGCTPPTPAPAPQVGEFVKVGEVAGKAKEAVPEPKGDKPDTKTYRDFRKEWSQRHGIAYVQECRVVVVNSADGNRDLHLGMTIENRSKTEQLTVSGWAGKTDGTGDLRDPNPDLSQVKLTDPDGKPYTPFARMISTNPGTHERRQKYPELFNEKPKPFRSLASLSPGEDVEVTIMFLFPGPLPDRLFIDYPGSDLGQTGRMRFSIDKKMISEKHVKK